MPSVLVLSSVRYDSDRRVAILDHLHFLDHAAPGRATVTYVNMAEVATPDPRWLEHDVIVLHTTLLCWRWHPQFRQAARLLEWMRDYKGLVVAMPQDEYDHAHVLDEWLAQLGTGVVVTCFGAAPRPLLYPCLHRRAYFIEALTGFLHPGRIAAWPAQHRPLRTRRTDVVYRANNLPYWFGALGHLKVRLGVEGRTLLADSGLATDISVRPEDTVLGEQWLDFLAGSRAILGSESGSSVLDRRGEVASHVRALLADQPALTFDEVDALTGGELSRHHFPALGPRHLEAAMTGTVQLLVEGDYSGVLRPWAHYIPVRADLSDLAEKAMLVRDDVLVERMTQAARADVVESGAYGYDRLANHLLDVVALFDAARRAA